MSHPPPRVLVVDDQPDFQRPTFAHLPSGSASFVVVHPADVDAAALNDADLVLVDYVIDDWPERTKAPCLGLRPANGVALAAVLREQASSLRPTGFAVHTGQPEALWLTPAEPRRHLIARAYNLEWVFLKGNAPEVVRQATILAGAIRSLPDEWPGDDHDRTLAVVTRLLGLVPKPDQEAFARWHAPALAEVEDCRPPLTELSERNHGLVFLRWLLHRIMPYPCFLLDSHRLAARLRVSHAALEKALPRGLGDAVSAYLYQGALAGFSGDRWWRAGIEDWLWDLTDGASLPPAALRAKLSQVAGMELAPSASDSPVVCVDEDYRTLPEARSASEVVRIQPDDWPLYAGQAWAAIEAAREHPRLRAIVAAEDREKVSPTGPAPAGEGGRE